MANYVRDHLAAQPEASRALITLAADGARRAWTFGELLDAAGRTAGALAARGVTRGSVVLTLVGNTIEYPLVMLACLHLGAAMLPCSEQLRARDIAVRVRRARPALVVCDRRNAAVLAQFDVGVPGLVTPSDELTAGVAPAFAELGPTDPAFVLFTSGTSGEPKLVTHAQRYVWGQRLQASAWLAPEPGELVWSTAAPGWSKSARNSFLAAWFRGAAALLEDHRFDPARRLATIREERVNVLCMAPTEYRLIAASGSIGRVATLRRLVTAGEALGVPAFQVWREATGLAISDGYGQTETGQLTGVPPGEQAPPGSMGRPLPGVAVRILDGELCVDPASVPTFFLGYDGQRAPAGWWHTGDRVRQDDAGYLFFESRADDVIVSAGYRIGPAEVESVLAGHPAVREAAVIGMPDESRGAIVAAVIVVRAAATESPELARDIQEYAKRETAPYKYPRRVIFVRELPKTTSGKIARAVLRERYC